MSVTNDPNYHEGQPAFQAAAKGEAYQPTSDHLDRMNPPQGSETGARCPWCGSEMRSKRQVPVSEDSFGEPYYILDQCVNEDCPTRSHYPTPEAALAAASRAARPLPDFPAVAPGLQAIAQDRVGTFDRRWVDVTAKMVEGELYLGLSESALVKEFVDFGHDILSRAPARPAAAGLTETERKEIIERAIVYGIDFDGVPQDRPVDVSASQVREAIGRAIDLTVESLLSSRATGAEVEIDEAANAFIGSAASRILNHKRGFSHDDIVAVLEARRIWAARRHATIRGKENI